MAKKKATASANRSATDEPATDPIKQPETASPVKQALTKIETYLSRNPPFDAENERAVADIRESISRIE